MRVSVWLKATLCCLLCLSMPLTTAIDLPDFAPLPVDTPQPATLADDTYHMEGFGPTTEWWYFDAILNDGYSVQMSIRISVFGRFESAAIRLDIYKDGSLLSQYHYRTPAWRLICSRDVPEVSLGSLKLMEGTYDEATKTYTYQVTIVSSQTSASLQFVSTTEGFKWQHQGGDWWLVMQPRATVTGAIVYRNLTVDVQGIGYHDHNWGVCFRDGLHYGWYWGKINSEHYTIIWSEILPTRLIKQDIFVLCTEGGGFEAIDPQFVMFLPDEYRINHWSYIPYEFSLQAQTDSTDIVVTMQTEGLHHNRFFGLVNYWRYHLKNTGWITVNGVTEPIDEVAIAELICFR